ncbi:FAD-binding protein [Devosia elaeis]|uniref:FAD-binding PCMH-type domain-containing protein n=1 Tax=Devosia elaeis TaxID=1770058 RepID=A0A178I0S7_9HYPH|nr:FAD-binding protein [Devosia elaeis]OAM78599.1 hypothetical protein A3840_05755 [Devosia elaeis]
MDAPLRNWAGNVAFGAADFEQPTSLAQLQDMVRRAGRVRVLGSGHSFSRIADTDGSLISLARLPRRIDIDSAGAKVRIDGGATYADLVPALHASGLALPNVASLPHITVAGAVSTATHGSGDGNKNLAASVSAIELVTASGEIVTLRRGDADFAGAVVGLGALGIISALTLDLVPDFTIRQNVYLGLDLAVLIENFDAVMGSAYSVSLFSQWQDDVIDQAWIKALTDGQTPPDTFWGARAAEGPMHPIPGMNGGDCTGQMGIEGPWHERLFHFPIGHKASAGAELQSEFFVARADAPAALRALRAVRQDFAQALLAAEIRSVAADDLWLSSAYGRDSIGFHFTWRPEWERTIVAIGVVEAALAAFDFRPHWAKVFVTPWPVVRERYPMLGAFRGLAARFDPHGKFRNPMLDQVLA